MRHQSVLKGEIVSSREMISEVFAFGGGPEVLRSRKSFGSGREKADKVAFGPVFAKAGRRQISNVNP